MPTADDRRGKRLALHQRAYISLLKTQFQGLFWDTLRDNCSPSACVDWKLNRLPVSRRKPRPHAVPRKQAGRPHHLPLATGGREHVGPISVGKRQSSLGSLPLLGTPFQAFSIPGKVPPGSESGDQSLTRRLPFSSPCWCVPCAARTLSCQIHPSP